MWSDGVACLGVGEASTKQMLALVALRSAVLYTCTVPHAPTRPRARTATHSASPGQGRRERARAGRRERAALCLHTFAASMSRHRNFRGRVFSYDDDRGCRRAYVALHLYD